MSGVGSSLSGKELAAIRDGDRGAFVSRIDRWVDRMHDAAQNIVGSSDAAACACHEVVQSLWDRRSNLSADDLTGQSLLLATRQRSLAHLADDGWQAPGTDSGDGDAGAHLHGSATRYRIVVAHAAATVIGAGNLSLLDLHYRHGVDAAALSGPLGVDAGDAPRRLAHLRTKLDEAIAAFVLWNNRRPACRDLATALDGGSTEFDASLRDAIDRHRATCAECSREHRSIVNPAGLFLTAPVTTVAPLIRGRVVAVDSGPDKRSIAIATEPLSAALLFGEVDAVAGDDVGDRPGAEIDIDDLWASTARTAPAPRYVPVAAAPEPARRRTVAVVVGAAVTVAMVAGGAVLALGGSDGGNREVVDSGSDDGGTSPSSTTEPEVRSLAPVPPTTERPASTTSTSTTSTTTSTSTTVAPAGSETSPTTGTTQVATAPPPRPPSARPSTPTSTVATTVATTVASTPTSTSTGSAPTTVAPTTSTTTTAPTTTEQTTTSTTEQTTTSTSEQTTTSTSTPTADA